jgi:hypothetical protein
MTDNKMIDARGMIDADLAEEIRIRDIRNRRRTQRAAGNMQRLAREVRERLEPIAPADVGAEFVAWLREWLGKTATQSAVDKMAAAEERADKAERRRWQMRQAVKAAEQNVKRQWHRLGYEEIQRISNEHLPARYHEHPLGVALKEARTVARAELRARWALEDAEQKVELPSHIERLP